MSVPLYAPTPIQPAHPTPFYIEDILGRTSSTAISSSSSSSSSCSTPVIPTPTLPSANSSFTSLISPYRTPIYEPTPIHPVLSHAALTATYGPVGALSGSIYQFHHQQHHRSMGDYAQALLRQDPLEAVKCFPVSPRPAASSGGRCTLLIILSTSSIQPYSGNTRPLIARDPFFTYCFLFASSAGPCEDVAVFLFA
ncbi:hypothetical protein XENOCAPTIV_027739 [Xenoophorus captivus]|uniref:Uncharacterized protein n=1 Tax=Xenoophorus captivus TaxID=1517983 RepID=A0ABV0S3H6_9TELE